MEKAHPPADKVMSRMHDTHAAHLPHRARIRKGLFASAKRTHLAHTHDAAAEMRVISHMHQHKSLSHCSGTRLISPPPRIKYAAAQSLPTGKTNGCLSRSVDDGAGSGFG